jgi:hypothetical protein
VISGRTRCDCKQPTSTSFGVIDGGNRLCKILPGPPLPKEGASSPFLKGGHRGIFLERFEMFLRSHDRLSPFPQRTPYEIEPEHDPQALRTWVCFVSTAGPPCPRSPASAIDAENRFPRTRGEGNAWGAGSRFRPASQPVRNAAPVLSIAISAGD